MQTTDLALVEVWLREPRVARWYLAGSTMERELEELRAAMSGDEPTHALIVLRGGTPIGWCQWYLCADHPDHADAIGAQPGDIGLDYALGEPASIGHGTGTAMIAALVAHIRQRHPAAGLMADPEASNVASRRVLEKNGFELLREGPVRSELVDATMAVYRLAPPTVN